MTESPKPNVDQWFSIAYEELRSLASRVRGRDRSQTLSPTALVHEAWARLSSIHTVAPESRAHFMAIVARAMRRVLVDAARQRQSEKRGKEAFVTLDEDTDAAIEGSPDAVIELDAALDDLARSDARAFDVVLYRFFGGFTVAETAQALQLSEATIHREWQFARAWLSQAIRGAS